MENKNSDRGPVYAMSKQEEDALIRLAAEDSGAMLRLFALYQGLLRHEAGRRYLSALGDETEGLAHLAFVEAVHDYDPERGVHFAAFLQRRVRLRLHDAAARLRRERSRTVHEGAAEVCPGLLGAPDGCPEGRPEETVCRREYLRQLLHWLSPAEKRLLNLLFVQDLTQVQDARILGVTRQSISKAKEKLLRRLRMKNGVACPE